MWHLHDAHGAISSILKKIELQLESMMFFKLVKEEDKIVGRGNNNKGAI